MAKSQRFKDNEYIADVEKAAQGIMDDILEELMDGIRDEWYQSDVTFVQDVLDVLARKLKKHL